MSDPYNDSLSRFAALKLGEDDSVIRLDERAAAAAAALALATQARRTLLLYTDDLDPALYDHEAFCDAITQFVTHNRHARIQVLVRDPGHAVKDGHRLIELARRLSSFIELRRRNPEYAEDSQTFLIADETGVLQRPHPGRFEGTVCFRAAVQARELARYFSEVWETSEPDPELRRLHL
jgi:hypothetical protein